jgi:hypothetical protein
MTGSTIVPATSESISEVLVLAICDESKHICIQSWALDEIPSTAEREELPSAQINHMLLSRRVLEASSKISGCLVGEMPERQRS